MRKSLKTIARRTAPPHIEAHSAGAGFKEFILGGQDGLVNVLGVILGIAAATGNSKLVIIAGLAATFAESFSMAAVAFTSTKAEEDHFRSERAREIYEMDHVPEAETKEIRDIYSSKGFSGRLLDEVVDHITGDRKIWLDVMMKEELGLSEERVSPVRSALVVGAASMIGSVIPLVTFFVLPAREAVLPSIVISAAALFATGAIEGKMTVGHWIKRGLQLAVIGLAAAFIGFVVGKLLGEK